MHPAPGFVQQFTPTNHGSVDGSPSISSTGVVFCILEQVEALGRRDPALVGEALLSCPFLVLPRSRVSLNSRGWEAIVGSVSESRNTFLFRT